MHLPDDPLPTDDGAGGDTKEPLACTDELGSIHESSTPSAMATLAGADTEEHGSPSIVSTLAGAKPPRSTSGGLEAGTPVGRHMVLHRLGSGGMGVVYAAYDPELDRKVALKLLLPGMAGPTGRSRLLREAQALARLSHPNVVAIHDMGSMGQQVWIAMELVQGQTLGEWLRTPRRWPEVLGVMRSAGLGLAAAHAAGLLHRDFKPDNVMVGDDGRVRVMDFGLARARLDVPASDEGDPSPLLFHSTTRVTRMGALVGTPAYMAPEQFGEWEITAAADQFSFCITLWEALYGERPFAGDTWMEISDSVLQGRLRPPAVGRGVPGWLRRACERGLAVDPEQRWSSLDELLDVLATGRTRARIRAAVLGVAGIGLLGAVAVGVRHYESVQEVEACKARGAEVERAWNPERAQRLREALLSTGAGYAATTVDKVDPWLEQHASAWRQARVEACLDAHVREKWDAETLERSLWCLDERRMELESLVDALSVDDDDVLTEAVSAAAGLSSVAPCRDERALGLLAAPPPSDHEAIGQGRAEVARAKSLERAGRYDEGLAQARVALEHAEVLGWRPLSAMAKVRLGSLLERTGAYADAETVLTNAYFEAAEGLAPEVAFAAANMLVRVVGFRVARPEEGRLWGRMAELSLTHLQEHESLRSASLLGNLGLLEHARGSYDEATQLLEQAIAIEERVLGPDHPEVAGSLNDLANICHDTGAFERGRELLERVVSIYDHCLGVDHPRVAVALVGLARIHGGMDAPERAKPLLERALAINEQALGRGHPHVGATINNLALVLRTLGELDESIRLQQQAVAIVEEALGPDHPNVAVGLTDLATVRLDKHEHVQARALLERALTIAEAAYGPDHPTVGRTLGTLALAHSLAGDHEREVQLLQRALSIFERAFGGEHLEVAVSLRLLANGHMSLHDPARADPLYERALAIIERVKGPDHPRAVPSLIGRAKVALARGRADDAVPLARKALELATAASMKGEDMGQTRFVLARALWDASVDGGRDRAGAMSLAVQAREDYRQAGEVAADPLAEVETWLREHEPAASGSATAEGRR